MTYTISIEHSAFSVSFQLLLPEKFNYVIWKETIKMSTIGNDYLTRGLIDVQRITTTSRQPRRIAQFTI